MLQKEPACNCPDGICGEQVEVLSFTPLYWRFSVPLIHIVVVPEDISSIHITSCGGGH